MSIWNVNSGGGSGGTTVINQTVSSNDIIAAILKERKEWVALAAVDFTKDEPESLPINEGNVYLSTVSGKGSRSTPTDFYKDNLYYLDEDLLWQAFSPKEGWILTIKDTIYSFTGGTWVPQLRKDHFHKIIGQTTDKTYFLLANKTMYVNKKDIVDFSLWPGDDGFDDDWEVFSAGGGQQSLFMAVTAPAVPDYPALWLQPFRKNSAKFPLTLTLTNTSAAEFVGQVSVGFRKLGNVAYLHSELPAVNLFSLSVGTIIDNPDGDNFVVLEWGAGELPANGKVTFTIPVLADLARIEVPDFLAASLADGEGQNIAAVYSDGSNLFNFPAGEQYFNLHAAINGAWVPYRLDNLTDGETTVMWRDGEFVVTQNG